MNIQIFGTSKCFDTKKAQRYFKERGIKFQMIDLKEKGMSRGEFDNVASCSRPLSCATDARLPWATSPRYGRTGNKKPAFTKKPPVQVLHSAAGCGILLDRQKTLGDSDQ